MPEPTSIHKSKQSRRPHYIREWAILRGFKKQIDLAAELGIDKSVVSRWYGGSSPDKDSQEKLAALFDCDTESLFRHPDDDWFAKFFKDRERDEIDRMKKTLELTFPRKSGTEG